MRIILFSCKPYDTESFASAEMPAAWHVQMQEARLSAETAALAEGYDVVCAFINDDLSAPVLERLAAGGTRLIALRSAGFNHVDLHAASQLGLPVVRVPAYSPYAVAEHAVALIMTLNRRTHRAFNRTREGDFSLHGLTGFDLHGKTVGIIGCGKIGLSLARIMRGFGCEVLLYDPYPVSGLSELGARQVTLETLISSSDIMSLHCPLT
ncbi:MAG TPA: hydroxyacid dehydrogenase, partial [Pseudomonas sp.]|nr:hydroxyacid dehydrogenase [Pseudomonas sp.]